MAGHNKWIKIKHRKKIVDGRRSKVWTKCVKAIMVAAKHGGPDPDTNLALRYAIDEARYANVPRDTIERGIKKGAGELGSQNFETVRYEGYGVGGVAIVVDALTDNRTRTAGDVRNAFTKHDGNLGASGCVAFLFDSRGQIVATIEAEDAEASRRGRTSGAPAAPALDADRVLELALEAGALDVHEPPSPEDPWVILTDPADLLKVKDALEKSAGPRLKVEDASVQMIPQNLVAASPEQARLVMELVEALEDNDDVQKVYTNLDPASVPAEA